MVAPPDSANTAKLAVFAESGGATTSSSSSSVSSAARCRGEAESMERDGGGSDTGGSDSRACSADETGGRAISREGIEQMDAKEEVISIPVEPMMVRAMKGPADPSSCAAQLP